MLDRHRINNIYDALQKEIDKLEMKIDKLENERDELENEQDDLDIEDIEHDIIENAISELRHLEETRLRNTVKNI